MTRWNVLLEQADGFGHRIPRLIPVLVLREHDSKIRQNDATAYLSVSAFTREHQGPLEVLSRVFGVARLQASQPESIDVIRELGSIRPIGHCGHLQGMP